MIDPEVEDQMVAAIERVMDTPDEARLRAEAGRRWVDEGFIRDDLARRMATFLEATLERNRS